MERSFLPARNLIVHTLCSIFVGSRDGEYTLGGLLQYPAHVCPNATGETMNFDLFCLPNVGHFMIGDLM